MVTLQCFFLIGAAAYSKPAVEYSIKSTRVRIFHWKIRRQGCSIVNKCR